MNSPDTKGHVATCHVLSLSAATAPHPLAQQAPRPGIRQQTWYQCPCSTPLPPAGCSHLKLPNWVQRKGLTHLFPLPLHTGNLPSSALRLAQGTSLVHVLGKRLWVQVGMSLTVQTKVGDRVTKEPLVHPCSLPLIAWAPCPIGMYQKPLPRLHTNETAYLAEPPLGGHSMHLGRDSLSWHLPASSLAPSPAMRSHPILLVKGTSLCQLYPGRTASQNRAQAGTASRHRSLPSHHLPPRKASPRPGPTQTPAT